MVKLDHPEGDCADRHNIFVVYVIFDKQLLEREYV